MTNLQITSEAVNSSQHVLFRSACVQVPLRRIDRCIPWSSLLAIVLTGVVLISSFTENAAGTDSSQESATKQVPPGKTNSADSNLPVPDAEKRSGEAASDIVTVGDADVDPIEISGTVLDVDSKPASKCIVRIEGHSEKSLKSYAGSITTDEAGQFRIRIRVRKEGLPQLALSAVNSNNSQLGFYRFPRNNDVPSEPISVQMAAARVARLKVIDKSGAPVSDASAMMQLPHPVTSGRLQTGPDGTAQFVIPASDRIIAVLAWKDNAGLDYRLYELSREQKADAITKAPEFPEGGLETLVLDGASPVTIKVVDDDGMPLKEVGMYPWLLKKESENDLLNLSYFGREFLQNTGENGTTTFAWLPSWHTELLQFFPNVNGFDSERGTYTPGKDNGQLEIVLKKMVPIRGHVHHADGSPVQGIQVAAVGAGYTFDDAREQAFTDKDGAYEILVPPNQIYLVTASAKGLASAPQTGFAVTKGKPVESKDFILRAATRIYGTLVDEETQQPVAGANIFVYQYGQDIRSMEGVVLPNPKKSNTHIQPVTTYSTQTNEQGQFELFIGDGKFDIRPPRQEKAEKFEIAGESEREFVVTTKLVKQLELVGTVRDEATNELLAGARVFGVSRNHGGRDWQATTNSEGTFRVMQFPAATFVHAVSADKTLGAILELEAKQPSVALTLQPVGTAHGRLLTTETKEPWGGQVITFGVRVPDENNQSWSNRFGGRVTTAPDGTFELVALVPEWKYELDMDPRSDGTIPFLGNVLVKPGETFDIGDVSPPPPRKPYVPPTLEERIAGSFNVTGTATERYAKAKDLIGVVNQHLLIVFGVPDDPRIHSLMKIRFEDEDFRPLSDEFRFMAIPTDEKRRPDADSLASMLTESLERDRSEFLLVLLDSKGVKVATATAESLIVDGELSGEKLFEWLRKYRPEPQDARKLLDEALAAAKSENKRVLVQETATWCGPCHRLAGFLNANRVWEKDYIWIRMDHRYNGARELMAEIRDGAPGGIPWFAILDADGTKLATSNDLKSNQNIGFPSEVADLAHFEHMVKSTRQRLTDDEITDLIRMLTTENE